jgi:hypothetical protein
LRPQAELKTIATSSIIDMTGDEGIDEPPCQLELAVFDLDYTVWQPEMCQLCSEPEITEPSKNMSAQIRREAKTTKDGMMLVDKNGSPMRVFPGA